MANTTTSKLNSAAAYGIALLPITLFLYNVVFGITYFGKVNDFPEYSTAARLALSGQGAKIYKLPEFFAAQTAQFPQLGSRNVALFLPPFDVPLLLPVALIPDAMAAPIWTVLLTVALSGGLFAFKRFYEISTEKFLWVIGFTLLTGPAIESVRIGQLSPILLMCLGFMALLLRDKRLFAAGLVFSLMLLKPQQMWPLLLFLIAAKQFKLLQGLLAVLAKPFDSWCWWLCRLYCRCQRSP
jgi:hypothetical protein